MTGTPWPRTAAEVDALRPGIVQRVDGITIPADAVAVAIDRAAQARGADRARSRAAQSTT